MIITQDLEHFHGWGLTMAMRSEGTFALGQRHCWPHSSGCLVCNKEKYKLPVKFYTGLTKLYQKNLMKCESILYSCALLHQAHIHTNCINAHKWANIRRRSLLTLYVQLFTFCVCAYSICRSEIHGLLSPQVLQSNYLGLNTCGTFY